MQKLASYRIVANLRDHLQINIRNLVSGPMSLSEFSASDSCLCLTQEFPIWGFKIPIKSEINRHFPINTIADWKMTDKDFIIRI